MKGFIRLFILLCLMDWVGASDPLHWVVAYGSDYTQKQLRPYEILVFDSHDHPNLKQFVGQGKTVLGYLSLGEIEEHRSYFQKAQQGGFLLDKNPNWTDSYFVDLRDKRWAKQVIEELIPGILYQKFTGLFLDTLDNAVYLEQRDPQKYQGMREAAIHLVQAIRLHYPQIKIMINRAFDLLPEVAREVDMLVGESLYTTFDFTAKTYQRVPDEESEQHLQQMRSAKETNPRLQLFSLDYWDPDDLGTIRQIYEVERSRGLIPYVSTWQLNVITPEPK